MKRILSTVVAATVALGTVAVTPLEADAETRPPRYSIQTLPLPKGFDAMGYAYGLSHDGTASGLSVGSDGVPRAVIWRNGAPIVLKDGVGGVAFGTVRSGAIIGTKDGEAVRWDNPTAPAFVFPTPGDGSNVSDVSQAFTVVGQVDDRAMRIREGRVHLWPAVSGGTRGAAGVSNDGRYTVINETVADRQRSYVARDNGPLVPLSVPGAKVVVNDVNDAGQSVGCVGPSGDQKAYLWDASGRATVLPQLDPGADCPQSINNAGVIVGMSRAQPVVWHGRKPYLLQNLSTGIPERAYGGALDINERGQVLGMYLVPGTGRYTPFVATPVPPFQPTAPYTKAGTHNINGRVWKTTCEPYSRTVRCRTSIWATQVSYVNGRFVPTTGWAFNNLTYLPYMTQAQWGSNPLARPGAWTSGGRSWRTECNTPQTGGNACRSFILVKYVASQKQSDGTYRYYWTTGWVFNNIVMFTP